MCAAHFYLFISFAERRKPDDSFLIFAQLSAANVTAAAAAHASCSHTRTHTHNRHAHTYRQISPRIRLFVKLTEKRHRRYRCHPIRCMPRAPLSLSCFLRAVSSAGCVQMRKKHKQQQTRRRPKSKVPAFHFHVCFSFGLCYCLSLLSALSSVRSLSLSHTIALTLFLLYRLRRLLLLTVFVLLISIRQLLFIPF